MSIIRFRCKKGGLWFKFQRWYKFVDHAADGDRAHPCLMSNRGRLALDILPPATAIAARIQAENTDPSMSPLQSVLLTVGLDKKKRSVTKGSKRRLIVY